VRLQQKLFQRSFQRLPLCSPSQQLNCLTISSRCLSAQKHLGTHYRQPYQKGKTQWHDSRPWKATLVRFLTTKVSSFRMLSRQILLLGIVSLQVLCGFATQNQYVTPKEIRPEDAVGGLQKLIDSGIVQREVRITQNDGPDLRAGGRRLRGARRPGKTSGKKAKESAAKKGIKGQKPMRPKRQNAGPGQASAAQRTSSVSAAQSASRARKPQGSTRAGSGKPKQQQQQQQQQQQHQGSATTRGGHAYEDPYLHVTDDAYWTDLYYTTNPYSMDDAYYMDDA
jgi:hypothetical protein